MDPRQSASSFSDLPEDVLDVLGALLPADSQTVAAASAVARSWRRRVPEAWACSADADEDDEDGSGVGGVGAGAEDASFGRPPLVDLDASAPDFLDRCAALGRLMPRGIASARLVLPGRRAVAAGAPSAPRVLAAFFRRCCRAPRGGGGSDGLRHLALHLDEDGVELFEDEEEDEDEAAGAGAGPGARPAALPGGANDSRNNNDADAEAAPPTPPPLPPHLSGLRSLSVTGGALSPRGTARLLRALARACPRLEALRLLPEPSVAAPGAGGLSDGDVPLLCALAAAAPLLATVEFSAAGATAGGEGGGMGGQGVAGGGGGGFTGAGLIAVARGLPSLQALRVHRLGALAAVAAADSQCFADRPCLRELHLGCDAQLPAAAARRLAAAAGGLSMRFRWAEPPLLRTATVGLAGALLRLDLGVVRLPSGDPAAAGRFVECLGALTRLQSLRCALTTAGAGGEDGGGGDRVATLDLSQLAPLTDLRALELTKQAAWSVPAGAGGAGGAGGAAGGAGAGAAGAAGAPAPPAAAAAAAPPAPFQHGRFVEPSLSIPLSPGGAGALAQSCGRLRSLRLRLSRRDVSAEGLASLSRFSRLETLSLVVDHGSSSGGGGAGSLPLLSASPPAASLGGGGAAASSSFLHATALVPLDLLDLPSTLASLHLCHVSISTPAAALEALSSPDGAAADPRSTDDAAADADADADADAAPSFPPPPPPAPAPSPSGPRPLSRLRDLDLEQCRLRPAQLSALASAAGASLRRLRLSGIAGLSDDALAGLAAATGLRELSVEAPGNRLVTQRGLLSLGAPLARPLRRLTWRSDDLSRLGPVLGAYAAFTALRALSLSCTRAAAERGARLRRASEAGAAGTMPSAPLRQQPPSSFFSSCAQQQQQREDVDQSPVDALRALLPLATLEFSGAAAMAPLRAAGGGAAAAAAALSSFSFGSSGGGGGNVSM